MGEGFFLVPWGLLDRLFVQIDNECKEGGGSGFGIEKRDVPVSCDDGVSERINLLRLWLLSHFGD